MARTVEVKLLTTMASAKITAGAGSVISVSAETAEELIAGHYAEPVEKETKPAAKKPAAKKPEPEESSDEGEAGIETADLAPEETADLKKKGKGK